MLLTVEFSQDGDQWRCELRGIPSAGTVTAYRQSREEAVKCAIADALHVIAADLRQGLIAGLHGGIQFVYVHGHSAVP